MILVQFKFHELSKKDFNLLRIELLLRLITTFISYLYLLETIMTSMSIMSSVGYQDHLKIYRLPFLIFIKINSIQLIMKYFPNIFHACFDNNILLRTMLW